MSAVRKIPLGKHWLLACAITAASCHVLVNVCNAQGNTSRSERIEAAAIFYLVKFVEWPPSNRSDLSICLQAEDPLIEPLTKTTQGKRVNGLPLKVRELKQADSSLDCQLLYLGHADQQAIASQIHQLAESAVLTVRRVDLPQWTSTDVELFEENNKLRIALNLKSAQRKGLKFSSELLALAALNPDIQITPSPVLKHPLP